MTTLRVALLCHEGDAAAVEELAAALRRGGHRAAALTGRARGGALERRGFDTSLAAVPGAALALLRGRFDVAHAFSPADAAAALAWRRVTGRPVVFTLAEPPRRERLADRRLRLALLSRALERSEAVTAASDEARVAAWRWLAIDVPVLESPAYERLYRELAARARP